MEEEIKKLKEENKTLKEQLDNFIPRRRIRRVFKQLKKYQNKIQKMKTKNTYKNLKNL